MTSMSEAPERGAGPLRQFFITAWGIVAQPGETMADIAERRPIVSAIIAILVVGALDGLISGFAIGGDFTESFDITVETPLIGIILPGWAVVFLVFCAIGAGLYWITSRLLEGSASYGSLFAGVCFTTAVIHVPPIAVRGVTSFFSEATAVIFAAVIVSVAAIMFWQLALNTILLAKANDFSMRRAAAAVIVPWVLFWGLNLGTLVILIIEFF